MIKENITVNFKHFIPYCFNHILLFCSLFLKILSGMANSIDPEGAV